MTRILFMGTPEFSVPILAGLINANYQIIGVVTQPDKKVGRKQTLQQSPVKKFALEHDLTVYQPEKLSQSPELIELIALQTDLIVTAAYGQFLPNSLLDSAKIAAVNVHGSLLPKYRGGAPIQYAIKNGDEKTGITIIEMVKQMDAGGMYARESLTIEPEDNNGIIFNKLSILGRDLLLETLPKIINHEILKIPQDESKVTFSPNIKKEEEQVTTDLTAKQAHDLIRALAPEPGAYILLNGERLKVFKSRVSGRSTSLASGFLVNNEKQLEIAFEDQSVLELIEVQPIGKKIMSAKDFLNGRGKDLVIGEKVMTDE